jgi:hypothetical protein
MILCPINKSKSLKFSENGIGGGSPYERPLVQIVISHIGVDFLDQLADAAKRAAPNCLLSDQPEPALHLVEPTGVGGACNGSGSAAAARARP